MSGNTVSSESSESTRLLPQTTDGNQHPKGQQIKSQRKCCHHFCLPSKSAILMLFWTAVVGSIYYYVNIIMSAALIDWNSVLFSESAPTIDFVIYGVLAIVTMLYPVSGLIADVFCGRLRTVGVSLLLSMVFSLLICVVEILLFTNNPYSHIFSEPRIFKPEGIIACVIGLITLIVFIIGLAGYQANFIQLGLDQLFEAPSQYLRLFILYTEWVFQLGSIPFTLSSPLFLCGRRKIRYEPRFIFALTPLIISVSLITLLIVSRWKRHWFYNEPGFQNPYKTVFKVIKFAKEHNHPLRRSAFSYSDNYVPSRLDFAKQRYGGPFTTEEVENVKTFLRIVIVLFTIGPLFALEVPASYFVFPLFGLHTLKHIKHPGNKFCTGEYMLLGTGSLIHIFITIVFFPICILATVAMPCRKALGFFTRIFIGATFSLLRVTSLLIADVVGHSLEAKNYVSNGTQCIFQFHRTHNVINGNVTVSYIYPSLNMHWSVLIPPSLFFGVGIVLVITSSLEFISAQSPQPMKGFLIGIFFSIRGLFQFLNSTVTLAFSFKHPWASGETLSNPPVTNCGFTYFLFTIVIGLIGLLLFSVAVKKYKYRERDEGIFQQQVVEDIYERCIAQRRFMETFSEDN